jgi:rhamnose transport system permease protein
VSATAIATAGGARSGALRRLAGQEVLLAVAVVGLGVVVGLINPRFLATRNLSDILLGNAYIAIAAVGMSMVIISGNIDISVGALIGVLATVSGSLAVAGAPILVAWVVPILVGVAVMAAQGAIVAYLRIPAIVVTLGMLSILKGGLISVTGGKWITDLPQGFHLADLDLFGVLPMPVVIMILSTVLAALWMRYSPSGRAIYATGGNPEAARLCGVNPQRTVVMVFALHGFFAGLASLVYATQLRVIQSTTPQGLELTIITAAVVGGVSILGGVGTVVGSTLAAILIAEITSALVFINVSPYWTDAVRGALILATVIADILRRRRRAVRGWKR